MIEMGERYRAGGLRFPDVALDEPGHLTEAGHRLAADVMATLLSGPPPPEWDYRATCNPADQN